MIDEASFVLDQHAELDFYCANSLKQQFAGRHVAPLGHIILIPNHYTTDAESLMMVKYYIKINNGIAR